MLLRPIKQQGKEGARELNDRAARFFAGDWLALLEDAREAAPPPRRATPPLPDAADQHQRRAKACSQVKLGEVSRARQALLAATLAPGTEDTYDQLTDPDLRPPHPLTEVEPDVVRYLPPHPLDLSRDKLLQALRTA